MSTLSESLICHFMRATAKGVLEARSLFVPLGFHTALFIYVDFEALKLAMGSSLSPQTEQNLNNQSYFLDTE